MIALILLISTTFVSSFSNAQENKLLICINNVSTQGEFFLRGLTPNFPYPVMATISILDSVNRDNVVGLADTLIWLGPNDTTEIGVPVNEIWQPLKEYHEQDPLYPADSDIYNQTPEPLFTEIRETASFPTSTMLVMDASFSMTSSITEAKVAVDQFIQGIRSVDRAGVIVFNNEIQAYQEMTNDRDVLANVVSSARAMGTTALYDALMLAIEGTRSEQSRRAIIVYADGEDNASQPQHTARAVIDSARAANIPIFTIAFGDLADTDTLKYMALKTGGLFFKTCPDLAICDIYDQLRKIIQNFYVMAHSTPDPVYNITWRTIDVTLNDAGFDWQGIGYYFVGGRPPLEATDVAVGLTSITDSTIIVEDDTLNAVQPGELFQNQLTVTNSGENSADSVTLIHQLPDSVSYQNASVPPDVINSNSLIWYYADFQSGRQENIAITVRVNENLPAELTELSSHARIIVPNDNFAPNNEAADTVRVLYPPPVPKKYDVEIQQTALTDTTLDVDGTIFQAVVEGDSFSYSINLINNGPGTAYNLLLWDLPPDSISILTIDFPPTAHTADTLFWQFDSLLAGDSAMITINAVVTDSLPLSPFPLVNRITVVAEDDTALENNTSNLTVYGLKKKSEPGEMLQLDLLLSSITDTSIFTDSDTVNAVQPGNDYQYLIQIRNPGLATADSTNLKLVLPDSVRITNFPSPPQEVINESPVWKFDTFAPDQFIEITLDVHLAAKIPADMTTLVCKANLIGYDRDSLVIYDAADTVAVIGTEPKPPGNYDLEITQTTDTDTSIEIGGEIFPAVEAGDEYTYSIVVKNSGPGTAYDFTIWDILPDSVTITDYSIPYINQIGDTLFWRFDSLVSGDSLEITITFTVTDSLPATPYPLINEIGIRAENDINPDNSHNQDIVYGIIREKFIPTDWDPRIEAIPDIADIGDQIRVRVLLPVPVKTWDIWINMPTGQIDSSYADDFIRITQPAIGDWTTIEPEFQITQMYTRKNQEQLIFELHATDYYDQSKSSSAPVTVMSEGFFTIDRNVFIPGEDNDVEIKFKLTVDADVRLDIHDITGTKITRITEANFKAGWNAVTWNGLTENGQRVGSGFYIITMRSGNFHAWKKLMIVR